jgi:uncharacterized protein YacL
VLARKVGAAMAGLSGVFMLMIGLSALGLTQSPRPSSISAETYSRMKGVEWVIGVLFIVVGMTIVRMVILNFTKLHEESPSMKETLVAIVPTTIVGALISVWVVNYIRTPMKLASQTTNDFNAGETVLTTDIIGTWNVTAAFDENHHLVEFFSDGIYLHDGKHNNWKYLGKDQVLLNNFNGSHDYKVQIINSRRMQGGVDGFIFTR